MKPSKKSVLIGLSGGVDSAIAAYLLKKKGYKVTAVFLKLYSDTKNNAGECSWRDERRMALRISALLNIPLITADFEKEYKTKVIAPMFKAYEKGLTPNPDLACNSIIKFPLFKKIAKKLNIQYTATGHYARIIEKSKGYSLLQGKDQSKDQSYFLAQLSQSDLKNTLFPLGNLKKQDTRNLAKKLKFPNWNKPGTAGICFVGKINMHNFLKSKLKPKQGIAKSPEGKILGVHQGIKFYTIGQKALPSQGISINKPKELAAKRFYIAEKIKPNTLIIAPENHPSLKRKQIIIRSFHQVNPKIKIPKLLKARIRHLGELHSGELVHNKKEYLFKFKKPLEALAEGQFIVLYKNQEVLGCGEMRF